MISDNPRNIMLEREYGTAVCAPDAEIPTKGQIIRWNQLKEQANGIGIDTSGISLETRSDYMKAIDKMIGTLKKKGVLSGRRSEPISHAYRKPKISAVFLRKPYS